MITLYGMGSPNVVKVFIALEELGLPYRVEPVDVFKGEQFRREFLAMNPLAKVPVIVDSDGPDGRALTIFESGAILLYLAEKAGGLLPVSWSERFEALQWLMVQLTGIGPTMGQVTHFARYAPSGNDYALSRYRTHALTLAEVVEERLFGRAFICGDGYTIADVATFPWLRLLPRMFPDEAAEFPDVAAWTERVASRPAVVRALAAVEAMQALLTPAVEAAPENLDQLFGRGAFARA